ncbi:MAG: BatD family protein [Methylovulum sp.]|nr:BatD family protein [Methylovulum sp.]
MIKLPQSTLFLLLILLNLSLFLMPQPAAATQIIASVGRNPVNLDESFQIIFTATDTPDDDPDFSPLEQDFSILNQSQSSNSSWINGQSSKTIQWTLNVMAKNSGSLVIPAIQFGTDASEPITVMVTQDTSNKDIKVDEDLFLEVDATPENPYLQSQVIYTLRLYTRVDIAQARLNEPELADAVIEKLGDDSNYNTQLKGVTYSVTERKYAIFPQKSGALTIKPLVLTAEVLSTSNRPLFNGFFNPQMSKTKRVESKAVTLQVKPAPANFTGQHWLPADQLTLTQQWSGDVQAMKVGEPLTRTLTLQAKGTTVGQLPELGTANNSGQLKSYPDQPVLKEQKNAAGLSAYREEKIALIPSKVGDYTLPAIEVPWFNTQSQKIEIAKIPQTVIRVIAASDTPAPTPEIKPAQPNNIQPAPLAQTPVPQLTNGYWPWVSLFLASGWLGTFIYFVAKRPAQIVAMKDANEADEVQYKDIIKRLKNACAENNATTAKNALLEWGRQQFNVTSLGAVAMVCDARLRDEILFLNQALYGYDKETKTWTGKRLFQAFTENKARAKLAIAEDSSLKPLYRL